ncbi:MAG: type II toxin-antitoxin system RelE/ParE family toxin [Planctomycetota bacterium]
MPKTSVYFYVDFDGRPPVLDWLEELRRTTPKAFAKCAAIIERLEAEGHELRRPTADMLEDGIYELRAKVGTVNYRILYCFVGKNVAFLVHGLTKEAAIPPADLDRAKRRKADLEANPTRRTYKA